MGGTSRFSTLFLEVTLGSEKLQPSATFADVASWPFFFCFREGKFIFGRFGALGGLQGLVGTIPSSSLYLLPLPIPFYKLGFSMTMKR